MALPAPQIKALEILSGGDVFVKIWGPAHVPKGFQRGALKALRAKGYVDEYLCFTPPNTGDVWCITDAGRAALRRAKGEA